MGINPKYGIPAVEIVFTMLHAGGKFGGGGYKVSGGLHGVGASVVNALSEWMVVNVRTEGREYQMRLERGKTTSPLKQIGETEETGSKIHFKPDSLIFEELDFNYDVLKNRLREMAFLNKGITIILEDEREELYNEFYYEGGILSFVEYLNKSRTALHSPPIYVTGEKENATLEIALQYNDSFIENIFTFANNISTPEGGTHLVGFKSGLTRVINEYARKTNVLKAGDPNFSGEDTREGLAAIISVKLTEPQFEGQTKTKLGNSDIRGFVENTLNEKLAAYLEENPSVARMIMEKCVSAFRAREAAKKARDLTRRKNVLESASLPGKLADCSERDPRLCEIFRVEGNQPAAQQNRAGKESTRPFCR